MPLEKYAQVCLLSPKERQQGLQNRRANGNGLLNNAISKEMTDIKVTFKFLGDYDKVPIGYTFVSCDMIFNVNMEEFSRKSRLVASGHMRETPATMTYVSVVYHETVCLALVIAALKELEVKSGDVSNA